MPRRSTTHAPKPQQRFSCLVAGCPRKFQTISGRTRHINAKHNTSDPRRENSAPQIPSKRLQARVNPPLSHDEPNLLDIEVSNSPHLGEANLDFRDHTPLLNFDSGDIDVPTSSRPLSPTSLTQMSLPMPSSPSSETDDDSIPAVEYHPYIDGAYFLPFRLRLPISFIKHSHVMKLEYRY